MRASSVVKRHCTGTSQLIALFGPGRDLRPQRLRVGDPQGQGLAFEGIDFDLRDC